MENLVLQSRLSDLSITQHDISKSLEILNRIMFTACSYSGLPLPSNELQSASLTKELLNFFLEFGYKNLNEDEFSLAFKINSWGDAKNYDGSVIPQIEPKGSFLNVMFCAKVLGNYMIIRSMFDRKMENIIDGYS